MRIRGPQRGVADAEEDAHALGRAERQIEAGDIARLQLTSQHAAGRRVLPGEQPQDLVAADSPVELEFDAACADPAAGRLALAAVVVLAAVGDLVDVVAPRTGPRGELADRKHL